MAELKSEITEIKPKRNWVKPVIITGIILFIIALIAIRIHNKSVENVVVDEKIQPVELVSVLDKPFGNEFVVAGTVTAFSESTVSPKVMGRVSAVYADIGKRVRQGEKLLAIEQNDYDIAIKQAESSLAVVKANSYQATTALENSKLNYQRTDELFKVGGVSQSQLEAAKGQLAAAQSAYDANSAQINQLNVMLEKARSDYNNTVITSPVSGIVAKRMVNVGEMISQQTQLFTVIQDKPLLVKANITEKFISKIKEKQEVDIIASATGKTYKGTVKSIAPQADSQTKAYPVEVRLDDVGDELKPGMVVEIKVITDWVESALVVPSYALLEQDEGHAVFIYDSGVVKKRKVNTGMVGQGFTQITSGLKQGDKIVGKGNHMLVDGTKVSVESTRKDDELPQSGGASE